MEILTGVQHHTITKAIYDVVIDMFEGNVELKEIKKDRLKQHINMFKFIHSERLNFVLQRFVAIVNDIRTTNFPITSNDLNEKLPSSLSRE